MASGVLGLVMHEISSPRLKPAYCRPHSASVLPTSKESAEHVYCFSDSGVQPIVLHRNSVATYDMDSANHSRKPDSHMVVLGNMLFVCITLDP